jgi:hypothetical protein
MSAIAKSIITSTIIQELRANTSHDVLWLRHNQNYRVVTLQNPSFIGKHAPIFYYKLRALALETYL